MLYRLIVGNFTSFAEEVQFDMFPNPKRENFSNHIYRDANRVPLLKLGAVYGPNGAGKSNFTNALKVIKEFATTFGPSSNADELASLFRRKRFKLPVLPEAPMTFLIEFSGNRATYIYSLVMDHTGLKEENLYKSGMGKGPNDPLFIRKGSKVEFKEGLANPQMIEIIKRQLEVNSSQSLLAFLGWIRVLDEPLIQDAYDWIDNKLEIIDVTSQIPWLLDQLSRKPDVMGFVKTVFSHIGLGITDLKVRSESLDEWLSHTDEDNKTEIDSLMEAVRKKESDKNIAKMNRQFPALTITEEDGIQTVKELLFYQLGRNGYTGTMNCEEQSSGTLRLLTLIPALYFAIFKNKTVIIDEIDNSLHPILTKGLIKYFGEADSNGQLIFTTHETALQNQQELLRPDEIWIVKKETGVSQIYSLNDFKIHKTLSLGRGYLDGRFGGIPDIEQLHFAGNGN